MKFATFAYKNSIHVGIVDVATSRVRPLPGIGDMVDLVTRYSEIKETLGSGVADVPLADIKLLAPIPRPDRNIFCVGKNYGAHAREFANSGFEAGAVKGAEIDEYPAVFSKGLNTVIGPHDNVDLHAHMTSSVDYEVELTVVIGKGGRDIPKADAYNHVFGYTIANDVTARDRQKNHKQWFLGKNLDTFCPMGPWIVTGDELDPEKLDVKSWVNGELRQNANTSDLIFDIPSLVSTISQGLMLMPGDMIATGTPAGVGIGFNPPKFLKAGDVVAMEISGIGRIENKFV